MSGRRTRLAIGFRALVMRPTASAVIVLTLALASAPTPPS